MPRENPKAMYLCLLDGLDLQCDAPLRLGDFEIRRYSADELAKLLRGRDDLEPTDTEQRQFRLWAQFAWASFQVPLEQPPGGPGQNVDFSELGPMGYEELKADFGRVLGSKEPVQKLVRTLNLLKPSPGPVFICRVYLRRASEIQTRSRVWEWVVREPFIAQYASDGDEGPGALDYELGPADVGLFSELQSRLVHCLGDEPPAGPASNAHLRIAAHRFERGDERLVPNSCAPFDAIDPLMEYDAALEALVIGETEKHVERKLPRRVRAVRCWGNAAPDHTCGFIRKTFWLRSKVAHGARTPEEIALRIRDQATDGVTMAEDARLRHEIPQGPYDRLLLEGSRSFDGYLMNLREVARRCIRYFCGEHLAGRGREETVCNLTKGCP